MHLRVRHHVTSGKCLHTINLYYHLLTPMRLVLSCAYCIKHLRLCVLLQISQVLCFCMFCSRGCRASSVSSVRWRSATNQRSVLTTTRCTIRATPERRRRHDQSILTPISRVRCAAGNSQDQAPCTGTWELFTVLVTYENFDVTSALRTSHRKAI